MFEFSFVHHEELLTEAKLLFVFCVSGFENFEQLLGGAHWMVGALFVDNQPAELKVCKYNHALNETMKPLKLFFCSLKNC